MTGANEETAINRIIQRLSTRFGDLDATYVAHVVRECHSCFDDCPIRDYVPLLVERASVQRLEQHEHGTGYARVPYMAEAFPDVPSKWLSRTFAENPAWAIL